MSKEMKSEWLPKAQRRYAQRSREGKKRMLDEFRDDYGYERKYAIKLLGNHLPACVQRTAAPRARTAISGDGADCTAPLAVR